MPLRLRTPVDDDAGHRLRAPSTLHAFNRYEIKYLIDADQVESLRAEMERRLDRDRHCPDEGYQIWSVYYDTPRLRFYWEKIEGLKFRRKLRVRHYGDRLAATGDTPVCVEIKQRVNRVTQKRRVSLPTPTPSPCATAGAWSSANPAGGPSWRRSSTWGVPAGPAGHRDDRLHPPRVRGPRRRRRPPGHLRPARPGPRPRLRVRCGRRRTA